MTLTVDGVPNFRSLGGLPTTTGHRVKDGVLYRSETLANLSATAQKQIAALNIQSVCDLRSEGERARHPLAWPGKKPTVLPVETLPDTRVAGNELITKIMTDVDGGYLVSVLETNAAHMPGAFTQSMRTIFDSIIDNEQLPLLVKCVAGKDRTGFVVANILKALDVQWEAIVDDYLASKLHIDKERLHRSMMEYVDEPHGEILSADLLVDLGSKAEYLQASFDAIDRDYGSYDNYLIGVCGLTAARHERLKGLLLDT